MAQLKLLLPVALVVFSLSAATEFRTTGMKVVVSVGIGEQDSPLQITGFKLPEKAGDPLRVLLHNASNKRVRGYTFEALIGSSQESLDKGQGRVRADFLEGGASPRLKWPEERIIFAHGDQESHEPFLRPFEFASKAKLVGSGCIRAVVIVRTIEFDDSSSWRNSSDVEEIWRSSPVPASQPACDDHSSWKEIFEASSEWGAGYDRAGLATNADQRAVTSFTLTCPLKQIDQRMVALCSM